MWINTPNARLAIAAHRGLRLKDARGAKLRRHPAFGAKDSSQQRR